MPTISQGVELANFLRNNNKRFTQIWMNLSAVDLANMAEILQDLTNNVKIAEEAQKSIKKTAAKMVYRGS